MFSLCRIWLERPSTLLSFTLTECLSSRRKSSSSSSISSNNTISTNNNNRMDPWATLTVTRSSLDEPWKLDVHQRKSSVYLNPLPAELLADSVVAGHFLSHTTLPSSRAVRVVSVNGNPAVSSGKVRREMNRSNTVVFQLVIQATFYRRALNRQRKEERVVGKVGEELNTTEEEEPLCVDLEDEHTPGETDHVDLAEELDDVNAVVVESPAAPENENTMNSTSETITVKPTPAVVEMKSTPPPSSPRDSENSLSSLSADGAEAEKVNDSKNSPVKNRRKQTPRKPKNKKSKKGAAKTKKNAPKKKINRVTVPKADTFVGEVSVSL
ncbi:hypothetical protein LSM04_002896 [Trypanosoma melophagium]|uniref:uncharacterized protein n=1 Tax=Trypanosoma melophagium TaxID=715481 RepID=UPI00351A0CC0|nr:hypothetical protein LSM04_002896 [Trypanosoma melophagium]